MRSRWTRLLPGFPALLLMPVILGVWVRICSISTTRVAGFDTVFREYGFPMTFRVERAYHDHVTVQIYPFLIDLGLAVVAAYGVSMAVDRLILHPLRGARTRKQSPGEGR